MNNFLQTDLKILIDHEMNSANGLISIMGKSEKINDIPAVQELLLVLKDILSLDYAFLENVALYIPNDINKNLIICNKNKIVLFKNFHPKSMENEFYWTAPKLPQYLLAEHGQIVMFYELIIFDNNVHIIPDWFTFFCWGSDPIKYVPNLVLKSHLNTSVFDHLEWSEHSFLRAEEYGLDMKFQLSKMEEAAKFMKPKFFS